MGAKDEFRELRLLSRNLPSYNLVEGAVQELKERYQNELDGVLMYAGKLGNHISSRAHGESLDLCVADLLALFNYDWLRWGETDTTKANELRGDLMAIGKNHSWKEDRREFKMGIMPINTDDYLNGGNYRKYFDHYIILDMRDTLAQKVGMK
jgi:hypothetical protein